MRVRIFDGLSELASSAGTDLGTTEAMAVDQARIDRFADATGDHQWIHVDPQRASSGPFGGTIAHGLLTLSLLPTLLNSLYRVDGISMAVNYGLNKVRFPSPVPVGSLLRASARIVAAEELPGAVQVTFSTSIAAEGASKPACVVESVARFVA